MGWMQQPGVTAGLDPDAPVRDTVIAEAARSRAVPVAHPGIHPTIPETPRAP